MVSTIEPRKNHTLVLNAWSKMIKRDDGRAVPTLVCVGNAGWMNDAFYQRLGNDLALNDRVKVLIGVSEQTLDLLYESALFTIFPSMYEGWGLPITEAIAHGKVPLVSRVSSHPEAGGAYAVYFDLASEADFQARLDELIYDVGMRAERERRIAARRPSRSWLDVGQTISAAIADISKLSPSSNHTSPPIVEPGRFYYMARNTETKIEHLCYRADQFRWGLNWHPLEEWGCWIRGSSADMHFQLPNEGDAYRVYLLLTTPASTADGAPEVTTTVSIPAIRWWVKATVAAGQDFWQSFTCRVGSGSSRHVLLRLSSTSTVDFTPMSAGHDKRISALGVKGFYVARQGDQAQRLALLEALQYDGLKVLSRRFSLDPEI